MEGFAPNESHRPGRMLAGLIASGNKNGRMDLTVVLTPADGSQALHRAYRIKKWTPKQGAARLFISLPDTADWDAGIKPVTPISVNLETGEVKVTTNDPRVTPLLSYAARAALGYAQTGSTPTPKNGTITVKEATLCGACGRKLTDPVSIDRGIGPECHGKQTGSKALKLGSAPTHTDPTAQVESPQAMPIPGTPSHIDSDKAGAAQAAPAPSPNAKPSIIQLAMGIGKPSPATTTEVEDAGEALARAEARIAAGDHSEAAYDLRDEAAKWVWKSSVESGAVPKAAA